MKKLLSVILATVMLLSCAVFASAEYSSVLRFDENGEFKILHIADTQDTYPTNETMLKYINHVLDKYEPDLVILGGDNTVAPAEDKEAAIRELLEPIISREIKFTLVFGNHDREQGVSNDELLKLYQKIGGKYCLAYDAVPSLSGTGNHNLPILASVSQNVAYNLYMIDSGTGFTDEEGHRGYECVNEDQNEWFEKSNNAYTALNGGKVIPSMVFQHIIVGEIYDAIYTPKSEIPFSLKSRYCNGKEYDLVFANLSVIKSGILAEAPCPGLENHGQFDAMLRQGVTAAFFGHDHANSFTVNYKGIDLVNTPGATFHSYGNDVNRGSRLITLHEGTTDYDSEVITLAKVNLNEADLNYSKFRSFFGVVLRILIEKFECMF